MKNQNYENHKKFYPPHHFIYLPLLFILQIVGVWKIFNDEPNQLIWILFSVIIFLFLYMALMLRQHYALGNQNRIVRLEFKLRYFELFGKSSDEVESKLSFGQLSALRFAYDDEFKVLLDKAIQQNISGDEIKKSITNWKADNHRV
ncbi:DUF6526 family protein [Kaistella antarctica]|uniref:Uncharacterized protein n=1 Tax=Kaistella antarctica TaxID=266748 RepID=A0A448NNW2_9FLAO|nr:DUF6526 family protein [Kaistella antarctica]KEY19628.1 hypothetical protein HY04_14665 [Kaistella antarctica]SEW09210.1 hypothetical protein SAMN05421765_2377 [Kaistella antarctica]VEH96934.1 Uncharacterised protein [Kaistella antarctica]